MKKLKKTPVNAASTGSYYAKKVIHDMKQLMDSIDKLSEADEGLYDKMDLSSIQDEIEALLLDADDVIK